MFSYLQLLIHGKFISKKKTNGFIKKRNGLMAERVQSKRDHSNKWC